MPIYVKRSVEPGSPAAERSQVILARCAASERIGNVLSRYLHGEIRGRSYLVAGHRGSGKTTLVEKVVHDARNEFAKDCLRPFIIALPGPMLFPSEVSTASPAASETQGVLEQIVVNLYRALARLFADAARERVFELTKGKSWGRAESVFELVDRLRLDLDDPVTLAELRGYWTALGGLPAGILFSQDWGTMAVQSQGTKEIVALRSCQRAYFSVAAKQFNEIAKANRSNEISRQTTITIPFGKEAASAIVGIGAGSAIGAGFLASNHNPLVAALGGFLTLAASVVAFNLTMSRTTKSSDSFEATIEIAHDKQSLARELPELIRRCRDAGLAPVFLIDELDKVKNLSRRMPALIRDIKFFVTEQALFFFLSDRSYYLDLERMDDSRAYPEEYTFFSERVFVAYLPDDWTQYLRELLTPGSSDADGQAQEKEAIDVLTFFLLGRSRMHAIDIRRALKEVAQPVEGAGREDVELQIKFMVEEIFSRRYLTLQVLMQLAVSVTFYSDPDIRARCADDPPYVQIMYDVLYYVSRLWDRAPIRREFRLDVDEFRDYLQGRASGLLDDADTAMILYLFKKANTVLYWICNPAELSNIAAGISQIPNGVVRLIQACKPLAIKKETCHVWQYDVHGRQLDPPTVEAVRGNRELENDVEMILKVQDSLKATTEDSVRFGALQSAGLLSSSPSTNEVFAGIQRLQNLDKDPVEYSEMSEDVDCVSRFAKQVRDSIEVICRAVVASWLLALASDSKDLKKQFDAGWTAFCDRLSSSKVVSDQGSLTQKADFARHLHQMLEGRFKTLRKVDSDQDRDTPLISQYRFAQGLDAWAQSLSNAVKRVRQGLSKPWDWNQIEQTAWEGWAEASIPFVQGLPFKYGELRGAAFEQMLCAVRGSGPGRLLRPDFGDVPIVNWTNLMIQAEGSDDSVLLALGLIARLACGFFHQIAPLLSVFKENAVTGWQLELVQAVGSRLVVLERSKRWPSVLIWTSKQNSTVSGWRCSERYATLAVDSINNVPGLGLGTFDFVLFENFDKRDMLADISKGDRLLLSPSSHPLMGLLSSTPLAEHVSDVPVVLYPLGVDDAITRLQNMSAKAGGPPSSSSSFSQ